MNKIVNLIFKVISWLLMALAAVFIVLVWYHGDDAIEQSLQAQVLDPFMITAYVALGLAIATAIIFSIISVAMNPKNIVKIAIILAGLVLLGVVTYNMAGNAFTDVELQKLKTTELVSKQVGAALYYTYIIGGLAVLATIYASIAGLFKR
ncbi:MAG: hypothetical protein ACQESX_01055 [Bacteroidota bacterium]